MKIRQHILRAGLLLALALASASCRTLQYREVQSDFQRAVQAEAVRAESPFVNAYQGVADALTDEFIGKLDEKLRPNAWMLRGISEWRSGSYSNANISAGRGVKEIERQQTTAPNLAASRDGVVLKMLPGLVLDSQLRDKLFALGTNLTVGLYRSDFEQQHASVLTQFDMAMQKYAAPTPPDIKPYLNYQVWRTLRNWNSTLGRISTDQGPNPQVYSDADAIISSDFSSLTGGTNRASAIKAIEDSFPAGSPYRQLIGLEKATSLQPLNPR